MTWNYRVIEFVTPDGDPWQAIHEVHYDAAGKPRAYTENPAAVVATGEDGEGISGLRAVLDMMATALDKPVLVDRDFDPTPAGCVPATSEGESK